MNVKRIENGFLLTTTARRGAGNYRQMLHFFPTFAQVALFITNTGEALLPVRNENGDNDDDDE